MYFVGNTQGPGSAGRDDGEKHGVRCCADGLNDAVNDAVSTVKTTRRAVTTTRRATTRRRSSTTARLAPTTDPLAGNRGLQAHASLPLRPTTDLAKAPAATDTAVPLPANCRRVPGPTGHAYQGKALGAAEKGLRGNACAGKCAATPRCGYWMSHAEKGCVLKYWGVARKKVYGDVYEAHGTCMETVTMDPGCALIEQTTATGGDGHKGTRVLGGYDIEVAATSRSTGSCSQLCKSTAKCNYWVVHNTKGCLMHEKVKAASFKAAWKPKGYLAHGTCNGYATPSDAGAPGSS